MLDIKPYCISALRESGVFIGLKAFSFRGWGIFLLQIAFRA